jgi:hypothetical protein
LGGGFERNADLGHAKPGVTLAVYAHMFTSDDRKAAVVISAALNT